MPSTPQLDDLIALNQEMAALVRAGIPLELGLRQHAPNWQSRFSALTKRIADRLSRGESLIDALRLEGPAISPAYAAVVEAGLQSGRLSEALEGLANLGLMEREIRHRLWLAAIYPMFVCILAYVIFVAFIVWGVPIWTETRTALMLPPRWLFSELAWLNSTVKIWGPLVPALAVTGIAVQNLRQGVSGVWQGASRAWWFPGLAGLRRSLMRSQFAHLLGLLLKHSVPGQRAVSLAAETTGEAALRDSALVISQKLTQGATWSEAVSAATGLPRFLQWMMEAGERQGALPEVLEQTAKAYQRQAERRLLWLRNVLPMLLVAALCGGIGLIYCLALFLPMQQFWYDLMLPIP